QAAEVQGPCARESVSGRIASGKDQAPQKVQASVTSFQRRQLDHDTFLAVEVLPRRVHALLQLVPAQLRPFLIALKVPVTIAGLENREVGTFDDRERVERS